MEKGKLVALRIEDHREDARANRNAVLKFPEARINAGIFRRRSVDKCVSRERAE